MIIAEFIQEVSNMVLCPQEADFYYLNNVMRMLWEQHVAWTRMTIISIVENLADEGLVTKRLLRNPTDIAALFQPLYGGGQIR